MNKKFIYLVGFAIGTIFTSCSDSLREEVIVNNQKLTTSTSKKGNFAELNCDAQLKANQNLEKIISYFSSNSLSKSEEIYYPDYYGGAYINDFGKLVVLIKGSPNRYKKDIEDIIGNQDVEFIACKNSYGNLNSIMKSLNSYKTNPLSAFNNYSKNFNFFYLDEVTNSIIIYLEDDSEIKKKDFKKYVFNSDAIIFKKMVGKLSFNATVNAGDKISSPKGSGSMAFRAKNAAGEEGIVTAGHVIDQYQTLSYNGSPIGICSISKIAGYIDAAFVPITEPYLNTASNTIAGTSNLLSILTSSPGIGTVVNKVGYVTGATSGKIKSTTATGTIDGVTLTNLTTADYTADSGDSGGIVYTYVSGTNTRYTVGVHSGDNKNLGVSFFSKAQNVLSGLNVTRY